MLPFAQILLGTLVLTLTLVITRRVCMAVLARRAIWAWAAQRHFKLIKVRSSGSFRDYGSFKAAAHSSISSLDYEVEFVTPRRSTQKELLIAQFAPVLGFRVTIMTFEEHFSYSGEKFPS